MSDNDNNNRELKNQVFSGIKELKNLAEQRQQQSVDSDFQIPVGSPILPSAGKIYPEDHPLHNQPTVDVRGMTAKEEDILTSQAYAKKGTTITELIRSCLIDKSINPSDLLIGDRNAIVMALRITGYGREYTAEIQCPACQHSFKKDYDLAEIPIKSLQIEPLQPGVNEFEFMLPVWKKRVTYRFLTGADEEEIAATIERSKKLGLKGPSDTLVTTKLKYSVLSIDGIRDRAKLAKMVEFMPAGDSVALRKHIDRCEPSIDIQSKVDCPNCEKVWDLDMPYGANFFSPNL